jgi:hypothetical protein
MEASQERAMQETPTIVPGAALAQQAGEPNPKQARRQRWVWVEASIWTDRMLAALETEVKGTVWFRLIDKVYSPKNLWSAWAKSAKNNGAAGVDGITIDRYEKDAQANMTYLSEQLQAGKYQPKPIRRTHIPKPDGTKRPLGIPTVCDRIVQGAVRQVIEPVFEKEFAQHSYGFRPGKGCKDALRRVDQLLKSGDRAGTKGIRGLQELLRHHPARSADEADQNAGGGRPGAEADRIFPESKHHGRA